MVVYTKDTFMTLSKRIYWLSFFSIAMGFLEAAVVIYLRKIYYPQGFYFPLVPIEPNIALVEIFREAATIIMLVGIGILTGRNTSEKFACFIYSFAVWDIFYYVFLKLFLNWPASLVTWDILFLIPVPWVGPVVAPCIVSSTMILLATLLLCFNGRIKTTEWILFILGSLIIITSFTTPYFHYLQEQNTSAWTPGSNAELFNEIRKFVPTYYNWWIFLLGESVLLIGISRFWRRTHHANKT
jgi:hypothetical protein